MSSVPMLSAVDRAFPLILGVGAAGAGAGFYLGRKSGKITTMTWVLLAGTIGIAFMAYRWGRRRSEIQSEAPVAPVNNRVKRSLPAPAEESSSGEEPGLEGLFGGAEG